ncbi:hypothetical protein AB0I55_04270 [Actinocatenispora sera]|uniref:hypothetical protein n=1 Tax=Actinocatenispora sera TaxID=390989 RepID=UPI0033FFF75C
MPPPLRLPRRIPPKINLVLALLVSVLWWNGSLGDHWLDGPVLLRGVACVAMVQLGFLCTTLIGGLLAGLDVAVLDIGTGRIRGRWLIGRYAVLLRTIPLPIRFGFNQPRGGVATARRWLLAFVPALASTAAMVWVLWQLLNFDRSVGPIPVPWLRPAATIALFVFGWLVLWGGQLNVPSQLPTRIALWRPRRFAPTKWAVAKAGRVTAQRLSRAESRGDHEAMQVSLDALADNISERDAALVRIAIRYHRGEYAAASAAAAAHLDVVGIDDMMARGSFCLYTGLAVLADQPVAPEAAARARELCPAVAFTLRRDFAAVVLALFALYDRDTDLALQFCQQAIRWSINQYDAGEAELIAAIAAATAGDRREAQRSLRRGRRRAPTSPLAAVVERRLAEPPAITVTVDAAADE